MHLLKEWIAELKLHDLHWSWGTKTISKSPLTFLKSLYGRTRIQHLKDPSLLLYWSNREIINRILSGHECLIIVLNNRLYLLWPFWFVFPLFLYLLKDSSIGNIIFHLLALNMQGYFIFCFNIFYNLRRFSLVKCMLAQKPKAFPNET